MVLFILVYFATVVASAKLADLDLTLSKIEIAPNNTIQSLQFENLSYNLTDFTICTWLKFSNFSHTQTIFRLTGNNKETLILWRMHVRPKETMRMTIRNRLVASESMQLAKGQWSHVCFQWKGLTGVWATFVNAKIHSVGQIPAAGNDTTTTTTTTTWRLLGKGTGTLGDDGAPCRNGWQAYGLYMTGSTGATDSTAPNGAVDDAARAPSSRSKTARTAAKRQAVFDSDSDDPTGTGGSGGGGAAPPKPFQWFSKTFAFVKRMFTFVIIPFFKFVRNTFFQTRSVDDTVVDVSETHLTVSDVEFEPRPTTTTTTTATIATAAAKSSPAAVDESSSDGDGKNKRRSSSSSKRETNGGGGDVRCGGHAPDAADRVTAADLVAAAAANDNDNDVALSPNARRYLKMVSDGLSDVGVNAAFVRRAFGCCRPLLTPGGSPGDFVVHWDRTRAAAHNVTVSPHVCGRL